MYAPGNTDGDELPTSPPNPPKLSRRERIAAVFAKRYAARHHQWLPKESKADVCLTHTGYLVTIGDALRPWNDTTTYVFLSSDFKLLGFELGQDWCDLEAEDLP